MTKIRDLDERIATSITNGVTTMWCAYAFAIIALISLPKALASHDSLVIISWVAQTFLQLVLLSIIMVGQRVQGEAMENIIRETHEASIKEFEIAKEELRELQTIQKEVHELLRKIESKVN